MVVFCYQFEAPFLTWSVIGPDGATVRPPTPIAGLDRPAMIHDMAVTQRHVVIVVAPFYFDPAGAAAGGSLLSWRPEDGTRIALIPRDGGAVRWTAVESFWLWHTANAHDGVDGQVVVDFVRWSAPGGLVPGVHPTGNLARLLIDSAGRVREETLVDRPMEFPRVDDRSIAAGHRQVATTVRGGTRALPTGDADTLGWFDADNDSFVTVHLPQRVPAGLHGAWLPTQE
jgi:carotenoid cleavage dioxygenase-like enzyme